MLGLGCRRRAGSTERAHGVRELIAMQPPGQPDPEPTPQERRRRLLREIERLAQRHRDLRTGLRPSDGKPLTPKERQDEQDTIDEQVGELMKELDKLEGEMTGDLEDPFAE
jgi:hypothetical protein